jgi:hypothetical protein
MRSCDRHVRWRGGHNIQTHTEAPISRTPGLRGVDNNRFFACQYLDAYKRKGFPWTVFEILEAPESKIFFGLVPLGSKLAPSVRRAPFNSVELKSLGEMPRQYGVVDVDFAALREGRIVNTDRH